MTKLKKCPFCGGEGKLITNDIQGKRIAYVECQKCKAIGRAVGISVDRISPRSNVLAEYAIEAWNTRYTEAICKD